MEEMQVSSGYPRVRELTRLDRKRLSELIKAFAERSGNIKITEMLPGQKGEGKEKEAETNTDQVYDLIKSVLQGLLEWVEDEVTVWFMDLIGFTDRDAYDRLPFDIEVYIIEQLVGQKGFNNFFSQASALYKKIRG